MALPTWITAAGSLGVIPEGVFYQQVLLAEVEPLPTPVSVTGTEAGTNRVICDSTAGITAGLAVQFFGTNFGGLQENFKYYVVAVTSSTTFTIAANPDTTTTVTLTTATGVMTALFYTRVYYQLIAGTLPAGIQISGNGTITGVPQAVASVQGVPVEVATDVTSKFVIRAYTKKTQGGLLVTDRLADRTFTLTITGNDVPQFVTPAGSIGTYYDGDLVSIQLQYSANDPGESVLIRKVSGELPLGVTLSSTGFISGYIQPYPNEDEPVGYDLTPSGTAPYDFVVAAISKNYQFTLEITDGKSSNLRTFTIFVYNRNDLTGDNTTVTADTTFVTADQTTERAPFLLNAEPSNLGVVRSDNYYAYRFIGQDYDTADVEYVISVNQGTQLPPGLELDRYSGWYYGFIPDQGVTEIDYSFNIQVRARTLVCTATTSGTNRITTDNAVRPDIYVGAAITFEGTTFGGIVAGTTYYVASIVSITEFTVSASFAGPVYTLSTASGEMLGVPNDLPQSQQYPFILTVSGAIDQEVTWLTDADLGYIENGATSLLKIQAVNRGGRTLQYRLASGSFSQLPQGLTLLPTGEIAGRVSFNTFSVDLGETTFDKSQSTVSGLQETTFDSTFVFTVNTYALDPQQDVYKVNAVNIIDGGTGYTSGNTSPVISISAPIGVGSPAVVGPVTVIAGAITNVVVANGGAGYTSPAAVTVTNGFGGTGAVLEADMLFTGTKEIVSVNKTFTLRLIRAYNKPYQNLFVLAMPPANDRLLLNELLTNQEIFPPQYIFRPDDPNFGLAKRVRYDHAFGLAPDILDQYVASLYLNHYWKNLVLGEIKTAQALDENGNVIYEVVYSQIVDNLVNAAGQSVSKIVNLPYGITDPLDGSTEITQVYPNSLINMRDQVIDVVGQISTKLPLWMTSKQPNGRVLGFTPAWVICYVVPGESDRIAYYLNQYFGEQLNKIDFKVDRYVLDATLSKNWDAENQDWTPQPSLTTFDRVNTTGYTDLGLVQACTELAFSDVNNRGIDYINARGGLDGATWISEPGQTPPDGTQVVITNGSLIVFVRQENYPDPPGSIDNAWSQYTTPFDDGGFDSGSTVAGPGSFDDGPLIPGGFAVTCTATSASTDRITCDSTLNLVAGDKVWFTGTTFGNIDSETGLGLTKPYYVLAVSSVTCTATAASNDRITCNSTANLSVGDQVWFTGVTFGNISRTLANGLAKPYYIVDVPNGTQFQVSETQGGAALPLSTATGSMTMYYGEFSVSQYPDDDTPVALSTDSGSMTLNYGNYRMGIWEVTIGEDQIVNLSLATQTISNDYITSTQGVKYAGGTYLYRPPVPLQSLERINWQPLITAAAVLSDETIFDGGSLQFIEPVDMYDPTDQYDKYLVFPKTNILE